MYETVQLQLILYLYKKVVLKSEILVIKRLLTSLWQRLLQPLLCSIEYKKSIDMNVDYRNNEMNFLKQKIHSMCTPEIEEMEKKK